MISLKDYYVKTTPNKYQNMLKKEVNSENKCPCQCSSKIPVNTSLKFLASSDNTKLYTTLISQFLLTLVKNHVL